MVLLPAPAHLRSLVEPHFVALAEGAAAKGITVFAIRDEGGWLPSGTRSIEAKRRLYADLAELAGWVVGVSSVETLLVGAARSRKTFIHVRRSEIAFSGARALGLSPDAYEIGFAFEGETPARFAERVLGLEEDLSLPGSGRLSDAADGVDCETLDCRSLLRGREAPPKRGPLSRRPGSQRLVNVPSRGAARLESATGPLIGAFIAEGRRGDRFYVCRDAALGPDYFEEVDEISLRAGVYAFAGGSHTILRTGKTGLKPMLGPLDRKVLDRGVFELGHYRHIGRSVATPPHLDFLHGDRPIDLGGFQLLRGWNDLEHWGVWSAGETSIAKFSVAAPPTAPVTLELEAKLLVTQASGVLELEAEVNGQVVASFRFEESQNALLRITIPPELLASATAFIVFWHRNPRSPASLGQGADHRRMALGLVTANLRHGV